MDPIEAFIKSLNLTGAEVIHSSTKDKYEVEPVRKWPYKLLYEPNQMILPTMLDYISYSIKWRQENLINI